MGIRYEAPRGKRYKKEKSYHITPLGSGFWWSHLGKRWFDHSDMGEEERAGGYSTHYDGKCKSVRAFRRLLRKWGKYLPPGIEFTLVSRYKGHDVYGQTRRPL